MAGDDTNGRSADLAGDDEGPDASGSGGILGSIAFLIGLLAFLGSALAYAFALATGGDVLVSLAVNAAAAFALVGWTARDTYTAPDSDVTSLPGALGTALLMLGVYGLVASAVVALTALWHDRFQVAIWFGAAAAVAAVLGFFTFPAEVVGGDGDGDGASDPDARGDP